MVYTLSHGDSFREFFENICKGSSYIVVKDLTKLDIMQEMNRWIELIFSQDISREPKEYSLGIAYLDKIVNILSGETIRSNPWICRAAYMASHKLSNSGLPASLYLRSEAALLPEMKSNLHQFSLKLEQCEVTRAPCLVHIRSKHRPALMLRACHIDPVDRTPPERLRKNGVALALPIALSGDSHPSEVLSDRERCATDLDRNKQKNRIVVSY